MEGMGTDACVTGFYADKLVLGKLGICPRNGSHKFIVRGIDEFGARVTLDNDFNNMLTFDTTRNMWKFYFSATNFTKWLVSVSCA
ncbi:hypothetical protein PENTCL1PPCAC_8173, partial [Pristionchus entomophagus]